jgi:hypothetical protein
VALVGDDEVDERHRPADGQSILAFAESRMAPVTARSSALRTTSVSWAPDGDHDLRDRALAGSAARLIPTVCPGQG